MLQQINEFETGLDGELANPDALYVGWAGSNDLIGSFSTPELEFESLDKSNEDAVKAAADTVAANLAEASIRLTGLGAENIVLATRTTRPVLSDSAMPWELPDLDADTAGVQNPELNDASGNYLNAVIRDLVPQIDASLESNVMLFDVDAFIRDIITGSGSNGFLSYSDDPSQYCVNQLDGDCSDLINYDGAHKTSAVHSILADNFISRFDLEAAPVAQPTPIPLPASGVLLAAGLAGLAVARRRRSAS